jgi:hypothetical protein
MILRLREDSKLKGEELKDFMQQVINDDMEEDDEMEQEDFPEYAIIEEMDAKGSDITEFELDGGTIEMLTDNYPEIFVDEE